MGWLTGNVLQEFNWIRLGFPVSLKVNPGKVKTGVKPIPRGELRFPWMLILIKPNPLIP